MLIRIRFRNQLINFDADPDFYFYVDADPGYQNDANPDPQHWLQPLLYLDPSGWR